MRIALVGMVLLSSCGSSIGVENKAAKVEDCYFEQSTAPICVFNVGKNAIRVLLKTMPLSDDEIALTDARVSDNGKEYTLKLSPDVSMIKGDTGIISITDVNFDGHTDMAISTSFGVANQYFDYWIFDAKKSSYQKVGNYPKFQIDTSTKTLRTSIKLNAAQYETKKYYWVGDKLEAK